MNVLLFAGVAFGLGMMSAVLWAVARVFEDSFWATWIFGFWLAFLCVFATRHFTGFQG